MLTFQQTAMFVMNSLLDFLIPTIYIPPQKISLLTKPLNGFENAHDPGLLTEHWAHSRPKTSSAFVPPVLTTPPWTSGALLTYSRMLFNLKLNRTLDRRAQRPHSDTQVLLCSWVQFNPQKQYSHSLLAPAAPPPPGPCAPKMVPLWNKNTWEGGTVRSVILQPPGKKFNFGPNLRMLVSMLSIHCWKPEQMKGHWKPACLRAQGSWLKFLGFPCNEKH